MIRRLLTLGLMVMAPELLFAFDGDMWLVAGDRVRVRSDHSTKASVVTEASAGLVVQVLSQTEVRDTSIPGDEYGHFWYEVALPSGASGWIYGKFLYSMIGDRFAVDGEVFSKTYRLNGKELLFGIAVEDAYPAGDDEGLTGSVTHALPFFYEMDHDRAILLKTESVRTFYDDEEKFPHFFHLLDSDAGIQQVKSVEVDDKNRAAPVRINFDFSTQTGGGTFYIRAKLSKDHLIVTDYKIEKEISE